MTLPSVSYITAGWYSVLRKFFYIFTIFKSTSCRLQTIGKNLQVVHRRDSHNKLYAQAMKVTTKMNSVLVTKKIVIIKYMCLTNFYNCQHFYSDIQQISVVKHLTYFSDHHVFCLGNMIFCSFCIAFSFFLPCGFHFRTLLGHLHLPTTHFSINVLDHISAYIFYFFCLILQFLQIKANFVCSCFILFFLLKYSILF